MRPFPPTLQREVWWPWEELEPCIARSLLPDQVILMQVLLGSFKNRVGNLCLIKVQMINILDLVDHTVSVILSTQFY